jgi:hypothetical protein
MDSKRPLIKSVKYSGEPVFVNEDESFTPYIPKDIVGHRSAYAACLHLVFQHTADVHITMLEILAEKCGFDVDDMINTISNEPRFKDMMVNPTLHSLGYFGKDSVESVLPAGAVESTDMEMDGLTSSVNEIKLEESAPAPKPKKIVRIKKASAPKTDS